MKKRSCIIVSVLVTFALTSIFFLSPWGTFISSAIQTVKGTNNFISKKNQIDFLMEKYYINDYDISEMEDTALYAYALASGDPYTSYIGKEEYKSLLETLEGDYKGIGVEVYLNDGFITVISAFDDSPAAKAGILPGDVIIKVDGIEANSENYQESINRIKGFYAEKDDTALTLTVKRGGQELDISLTREEIKAQTVKSHTIDNTKTGYIRISNFAENTVNEFEANLNTLLNENVTSLIIDLRDNPGGILESVVGVADILLPEGDIVTIKNKAGDSIPYKSDKHETDLPICVLINSNSASASEVLAGALRDYKKATLIGTKTFGKGVVQTIIDFGDETAFKYTNARYYTPAGECIDQIGIKPDIEVTLSESAQKKLVSTLTFDEDLQLAEALKQLQ